MTLLTMENEHIASLEQALSELQAQDVNTQQKLDILITHITSLKSEKPVITPNSCLNFPHSVDKIENELEVVMWLETFSLNQH